MKEKILAKLLIKYAGLSKTFLGQLAEKLSASVTAEDQIEGKLTELDSLPISVQDLATEFQKEGDRRVTEAQKAWAKANPTPPAPGKTEGDPNPPPPVPDDTPAWAKALVESNKTLLEKVGNLEKEKQANSIIETLTTKLEGVPEKFWKKRVLPEKTEDIDAFVTDAKADFESITQTKVEDDLSKIPKPAGGNGKGKDTKAASKEELDAVVPNII
jgi:hypothetical protein